MENFSGLPIEELLRPEGFACGCGKRHRVPLRHLALGAGALGRLPGILRDMKVSRPQVVMDGNTRAAAGDAACALLERSGIPCARYCFPQPRVEPDERAVGQVVMALDPACDAILAVGSGTINDVCKIAAKASGRPLAVVATAPSMDGFASNTSSMISEGVKKTIPSVCPAAVVADTDILRLAPERMLLSGLGDMLAKYISVCEWRLSNLITGEYYCEGVAAMMRRAARKCRDSAAGLARRDGDAVRSVAEGLILSGIAMSFAEVSRPASGLEHYFSHIWEMRSLASGTACDLHGIQVGVGTLLTLRLYEWLRAERPDRARALAAAARFDRAAWAEGVRRVFGPVAETVLEMEPVNGVHDASRHGVRLERILAKWPEIMGIVEEELPPYGDILTLMRDAGEPALPREIGISPGEAADALTASMDIRDKYICSRLLWDLGLLEEYAGRLGRHCAV